MLIFTQFQNISCLGTEMSSVWKLGSRASDNIAFYREKQEKIVAKMISKNHNFSWYDSVYIFFAWPQFTSFG